MLSLKRLVRRHFIVGQHMAFFYYLIRRGNKFLSYKLFKFLLCNLRFRLFGFFFSPILYFNKFLFRLMPIMILKIVKVKKRRYFIKYPFFLKREQRRYQIALQWFFKSFLSRYETKFQTRLLEEIFDILQNRGNSIKRNREEYQLCQDHMLRMRFKQTSDRNLRKGRVYIKSYK